MVKLFKLASRIMVIVTMIAAAATGLGLVANYYYVQTSLGWMRIVAAILATAAVGALQLALFGIWVSIRSWHKRRTRYWENLPKEVGCAVRELHLANAKQRLYADLNMGAQSPRDAPAIPSGWLKWLKIAKGRVMDWWERGRKWDPIPKESASSTASATEWTPGGWNDKTMELLTVPLPPTTPDPRARLLETVRSVADLVEAGS